MPVKSLIRCRLERLAVGETITFDDLYLYKCAKQAKHKICRDGDKCFVAIRDSHGRGTITRIRDIIRRRLYQ